MPYACLFVYMFHLENKYTGHAARLSVEISKTTPPKKSTELPLSYGQRNAAAWNRDEP